MFTLADVPLTATHLKRRWQSTQTRCRVRLPGPRARGRRLSGRRGRAAATCAWPECGVATLSRGPDAAPCSCCSPQGRRGSVGRGLGRRSGRLLSAAGRPGPAADRLGAPPILLQPARGPGAAHPAGEAPRARPARAPRSRRAPPPRGGPSARRAQREVRAGWFRCGNAGCVPPRLRHTLSTGRGHAAPRSPLRVLSPRLRGPSLCAQGRRSSNARDMSRVPRGAGSVAGGRGLLRRPAGAEASPAAGAPCPSVRGGGAAWESGGGTAGRGSCREL